ncbi:hypothetical protein CHARACLAT_013431 [Characodon lateralis]|uniref:Uncharacterized protein n=1 Tax=Characodon lateralis TaxID=208331 RepID=A0ABU7E092_9TELE|nr:hypothetical protein [Characodon lateralis]
MGWREKGEKGIHTDCIARKSLSLRHMHSRVTICGRTLQDVALLPSGRRVEICQTSLNNLSFLRAKTLYTLYACDTEILIA